MVKPENGRLAERIHSFGRETELRSFMDDTYEQADVSRNDLTLKSNVLAHNSNHVSSGAGKNEVMDFTISPKDKIVG